MHNQAEDEEVEMTHCPICKEDVNGPCQSMDEARDGGCINPPQIKRGGSLNRDVAVRVAGQIEGAHALSSGSGSYTN